MKDILDKLLAVEGVTACAVFDTSDACVACHGPSAFEPILFGKVMSEFQEALNFFRSIDPGATVQSLFARFDEGFVDVRWVDKHSILVMGSNTANPAMVTVGMNVAALKLSKSLAEPGGGGGMATGSGPVVTGTPVGDSSHGRSLSLSVSPHPTNQPIPADAVGLSTVNMMVKSLAKQLGPFAKIIVKEELTKLGATAHTIGRAQFEDLINICAKRVADPGKRREFINEVRGTR